MWPYEPLPIESDLNELDNIFNGRNYKEDYQILVRAVRALGSTVPAMINAYMNLSPTMRSFGTAINSTFGNTDETGILVTLRDIVPEKRQRYLESYETKNRVFDRLHLFRINMKKMPWWKQMNEEERDELRRLKSLKEMNQKDEEGAKKRPHKKKDEGKSKKAATHENH